MKKALFLFLCVILSLSIPSQATTLNPNAKEVLDYWFGNLSTAEDYSKEKAGLWFGKNAQTDQYIAYKFGDLLNQASNHQLDSWKDSPRGRLALIILLDQFSRNIYRNSPQAFAYDNLAQKLVQEGLELEDDRKLFPIERVFFYLPLEHSENLDQQKLSVEKFNEIVTESPQSIRADMEDFAQYAIRHYDIIARFGRFPHRNQILGRPSTAEEIEFLKEPGSSF